MSQLNYARVVDGGPGWTRVQLNDGRTVTIKGDRAVRNNNPGNLRAGKFARKYGAIGDDGAFAVFPSRELGLAAQAGLLFDSVSYRDLTLGEAISRYAPDFENNTAAYKSAVAAASGVSLDTKMADIPAASRTAILGAMHAVEGNTSAAVIDDATGVQITTITPEPFTAPTPFDGPATATDDPFSLNDLDHPATPGWLSGPVAATPVDVADFSTASPLGGGLQDVADVTANAGTISGYNRAGLDPSLGPVMDALSTDFGDVGVLSGYRDPSRNARVGGARRSQHIQGKALDLDPAGLPDIEKARMLDRAINSGAMGVGIYPGGSVHIDTRNSPAFWGPTGYGYSAAPVSAAPEWAQPMLADMMEVGPDQPYNPHFDAPTPTPRPSGEYGVVPDSIASLPAIDRSLFGTVPQAEQVSPLRSESVLPDLPSMVTPAAADTVAPSLASNDVTPIGSDFVQPSIAETLNPSVNTDFLSPTNDVTPATPVGPSETLSPLNTAEPVSPTMSMADLGALAGSMVGPAPQSSFPARPEFPGALPAAETISPVPGLPAAQTISPVANPTLMSPTPLADQPAQLPALPDQASIYGTPELTDDFPTVPEVSNWDKFAHVAKPIAKYASIGNTVAGPLGALAGGALGAFGFDGFNLGPQFDNVVPDSDRFSTGFGLPGIMGAMGGPFGAQGFSLSNPGMSFTSLGDRVGTGGVGLRRSDKYGWTEVVGPDGSVRGIHFDNPMGGGIFGDLSRSVGGFFGGGKPTDKEKSEFSGKAGLW